MKFSRSRKRPYWPDIGWWTCRDFGSLEDHHKQNAIEELHKSVCGCGIIWRHWDGAGPSSIFYDGRDNYYGTMLNHIKQAFPLMWQLALTEEIQRKIAEWNQKMKEVREQTSPKFKPI